MSISYNLRNIRDLLTEGFTDEELRRLCYDISDFRSVYNQLARNSGKAEIVDRLLEHAEQKLQIEMLLAMAKEHNPARYEKHQPYYETSTRPKTSDDTRENSSEAENMKTTERSTAYLQKCLQESFDAGELADFCWHNLPGMRIKLSGQESVEEIVRKIIRYCDRRDELDILWDYLADANPKKYKMYYDKYGSSFDYVNRLG